MLNNLNINIIECILIILAYMLGSISFGLISAKIFKLQDPRTFGSKNIGATNILRSGNKLAAIFTLLGDLLKGAIAVYIAKYLLFIGIIHNQDMIAYIALSVFIGHLFPLWLKFQGGKGVATAAGVLLAINWLIGIAAILTWIFTAFIFRYSSLAAIAASIIAPIFSIFIYPYSMLSYVILLMSGLLLFKHKTNILNLLNRTESKIGQNP